jgi:hypothetical protein
MAMPEKIVLYDDNTQFLQLFGLTQVQAGIPLDQPQALTPVLDATVRATLKDSEDINVPGCINILLAPVGSPPTGNYYGVLGADFDPEAGDDYMLVVTADHGPDHLEIKIPAEVQERRS